jgi:hypothetical protein
MDNLQILPLAITMMAGPQIMSDIVFITSKRAVAINGAFVVGVAIAATAGTAIAWGLVSLLGINLGNSSDSGSAGTIIQLALVALLVLGSIKNVVRRETIEPPKWLGALQEADQRKAFTTGLLVILAMPSDILIMLTVGTSLEQTSSSFVDALPFIGATVLVAALPLLGYLLFRRRAQTLMPKVRDWMNDKAWAVNVIVYCIFILLILA